MAQTKAQLLGPVVGDVIMDVSTLSLDAEGNKVGIGTTAADLTLHVNGVNALPSTSGSTPTGHLTLRAKAQSSSHGMFMGVSNASPWSSWIQAQDANNNATNYPLLLNPNGGNIGIGTDNPSQKLVVKGTTSLMATNSTNQWMAYTYTDNTFRLNYNGAGADEVVITSAGDMGLGTESPTSFGPTFQIAGTDPALLLQDTATAVDYYGMNIGNGHVTSWFDDSAYFAIGTAAGISGASYDEKLRIDSSGRLGLGVTPEAFHSNNKAVIRGDSGYSILGRGDNSLNIGQNFYYDSSDAGKYIANGEASVYNQSDGQHVFYSAVSGSANAGASLVEKLRISNAGDVTLGYAGTSLYFQNGFNNSTARIQNGGGSNNSELKFLVRNAGTESEKMRLTSTAGLAVVTAGSMPANAGNETLYIQGEGHNGHGTSNTRSVVSIIGALTSNSSGAGLWLGTRTNENTAVVGTRTASGNLAIETYSGGWGERLRVTSAGQLLVNTSTSRIVEDHVGNGPQGKIQIEGTNSDAIMSIISAGTADANRCGTINLGRHRNSTIGGTPTIVNDNDSLGAVVFSGGDGTDMRCVGAKIHAEVDGQPGANDMPGALVFSTTPDGVSGPYQQERLRISSSGNVGVGVTNPSCRLDVSRAAAGPVSKFYDTGSNGGMYYSTGPVIGISRVSNGSVSQHGLLFQVGWDKNSSNSFNIDETVLGVGDKGVGIGEDDPQVMLHCSKLLSETTSYKDAQMIRIAGTGGADQMAGIGWGYHSNNPASSAYPSLWLGAKVSSWTSYVRHDMIFATRELDTNTEPKERFRIKGNSQFQYSSYRAHKYSDETSTTSLYRFRLAINMIGNVSYTIRLGNFGNGAHHVRLMGSHWTSPYHLVKESYYYTDSYAGLSETSVHNITSSSQGAWSVSRPASGQTGYQSDLIITKSAGTYHGGHVGMIDITTNRDLRLISIT